MIDLPDDQFEYRVGTSMLSEFAASHSPADVLRELVQNEYDAGGRSLTVELGIDSLRIQGTGAVIDQAGWNRLSVMVGTGLVAGTSVAVDPKVNGIGSKNFGLRSLFLFGDEISIASGGKLTVMDRRRGALRSPVPHTDSHDVAGVTIEVPYRRADDGDLKAFDENRERRALREMAEVLAPTLVKLAAPRSTKSIASVTVSSQRLDYRMTWTQTVKKLQQPGSPLLRTVRVQHDGDALPDAPRGFSEMEYTRTVVPPLHLRGRPLPSYFRRPGGRISLGISFETYRRRLVPRPGIFFYPLGAPKARTGAQYSVSAPFAMNEDRSQLLDPAFSDWNAWLLEEAAAFSVDLLRTALFEQFGSAAYVAVDTSPETAAAPHLADSVAEKLRNEACWPSRALFRKRPTFAKASTLTVTVPELPRSWGTPCRQEGAPRQLGRRRRRSGDCATGWSKTVHCQLAHPVAMCGQRRIRVGD